MTDQPAARAFTFRGVVYDPHESTLESDGNTIRLQPVHNRLLQVLVDGAGQIITYEEIHAAVWSDQARSLENRRQAIRGLRAALVGAGVESGVLRTERGVGIGLMAEVSVVEKVERRHQAHDRPTGRPLPRPVLYVTAGAVLVVLILFAAPWLSRSSGSLPAASSSRPAETQPMATETDGPFRWIRHDRIERVSDRAIMVRVPAGVTYKGLTPEQHRRLVQTAEKIGLDPDQAALLMKEHGLVPGRRQTGTIPGFWIDRSEVSRAQFERFRPVPEDPRTSDDHPIQGVELDEAQAYCESVGARLPTDDEWDRAARGDEARLYPWGIRWRVGHATVLNELLDIEQLAPTTPVTFTPSGASGWGALDLAGNVWEWVVDPESPDDRTRGWLRGGSWETPPILAAIPSRLDPRGLSVRSAGFRCVVQAPIEPNPG